MTEIQIFIHSLQLEWSLQQTSIKQKHILTGEAVARSENTTKSIFCGNFSSCGSPPVFLYRFVGKLSCSGVDQEGFPGLTPPPAAAENDLPIFQQNFASYFWETPCEIMTGISSRTESFGSSGNINLEYKKNTSGKVYRLRRSAAVQVEAVVQRKET